MITHLGSRFIALAFSMLTLSVLPANAASPDESFEKQVRPILEENCLPCHDASTRTSGLSVLSREDLLQGGARHGAAISPGHPDQSVLLRLLRGKIAPQMPMGKKPLSEDQLAVIGRWIENFEPAAGSQKDSRPWWLVRDPTESSPPEVIGKAWARNPIDHFIQARIEEKNLEPSPEASKTVLLRRAYFDLIGVPPTPQEARQFLSDKSADAYERLVDRLLDDPRYGERWGRHWLDLARYADTMGFEADREQYHMWRYRDYVIDAFNQDKPYDEFIKEQIAADEIAPKDPEKLIATGFLRLGPVFQTTIAAQLRQMLLTEMTNTVGSVFLGLTVGCAQCHDHKYDPIPQKDFYRLQAFFVPIEFREIDLPFADAGLADRMDRAKIETQARLEKKAARLKAYEDKLIAKWESLCQEKGCPDEEVKRERLKFKLLTAIANGLVPNDDPAFTLDEKKGYLELLDYVDGRMGGRDMGMFRRQVERHKPRAHVVQDLTVHGFRPSPPAQFIRVRGEYNQLGERVEPGFLSVITGHDNPALLPTDVFGNVRQWRIALAKWIASPDNPLTARVMVNRIWQHHFGQGIVATPSDYGRNGARPTHPELLDWLAAQFVENDWSIKAMHRLMMTSAVYRQSSQHRSPKAEQVDPANRLLWRMSRRRLEGEIIRDSILSVSGRLNTQQRGPGFFPRLPDGLDGSMRIKNFTAWEPSGGTESRRRSVYIFQRRQLELPFMTVMDAPVLQAPSEKRPVSTTALQALTLMNGRLVTEESRHFADRIVREAGPDTDAQIQRAFELALVRPPNSEEFARAQEFLNLEEKEGLVGLCRVLLNTNEFVYVD